MKKEHKQTSGSGMGATSALTMIFIVLKLVGVINWSWWWVLSPLWIGTILGLVAIGIGVIGALLFGGNLKRKEDEGK